MLSRAFRGSVALPKPCFQTSLNYKRAGCCYFKPPVCGTLLGQPWQINTPIKGESNTRRGFPLPHLHPWFLPSFEVMIHEAGSHTVAVKLKAHNVC